MIAGLAIEKATSLILLYSTIILKVAWITWINDISVFLSKNDSSLAIGNIRYRHTTPTFFRQIYTQHVMQDGCINDEYSLRNSARL
ncbi:hypothetical protein T09_4863 [Trichinella sp. T9]|nr:hypothetical protein T09_4863 [Trichinella sp. T9]